MSEILNDIRAVANGLKTLSTHVDELSSYTRTLGAKVDELTNHTVECCALAQASRVDTATFKTVLDRMQIDVEGIRQLSTAAANDTLNYSTRSDHQTRRLEALETKVTEVTNLMGDVEPFSPNPRDKTSKRQAITLATAQAELRATIDHQHDRDKAEFDALKARVAEREKDEKEESTWWRRQRWQLAFAAGGAVLMFTLGSCGTFFVAKSLGVLMTTVTVPAK